MNEKKIEEFVETLYPYFLKKLKKDSMFKNSVMRKNATVVNTSLADNESNIGKKVEVALPYDKTSFFITNETGQDLITNDLVCIEYCIDLKNAVAVYKVN